MEQSLTRVRKLSNAALAAWLSVWAVVMVILVFNT
jgi:hypothetical protein